MTATEMQTGPREVYLAARRSGWSHEHARLHAAHCYGFHLGSRDSASALDRRLAGAPEEFNDEMKGRAA